MCSFVHISLILPVCVEKYTKLSDQRQQKMASSVVENAIFVSITVIGYSAF